MRREGGREGGGRMQQKERSGRTQCTQDLYYNAVGSRLTEKEKNNRKDRKLFERTEK